MNVGGHEGTVESLSIRTILLRGVPGTVYTVPFSEVGAVINYTRDFCQHDGVCQHLLPGKRG